MRLGKSFMISLINTQDKDTFEVTGHNTNWESCQEIVGVFQIYICSPKWALPMAIVLATSWLLNKKRKKEPQQKIKKLQFSASSTWLVPNLGGIKRSSLGGASQFLKCLHFWDSFACLPTLSLGVIPRASVGLASGFTWYLWHFTLNITLPSVAPFIRHAFSVWKMRQTRKTHICQQMSLKEAHWEQANVNSWKKRRRKCIFWKALEQLQLLRFMCVWVCTGNERKTPNPLWPSSLKPKSSFKICWPLAKENFKFPLNWNWKKKMHTINMYEGRPL